MAFLAFAHIGDLHLTDAAAANAADYRAIVDELNRVEGLSFAYLPGDNADNGRPAQYALVREGLDRLAMPAHVITGDHDVEGGSLDAFYAGLGVRALPYATTEGGVRCLFLDMSGPGRGGPDFRLGADQVGWLAAELAGARDRDEPVALFMHSYPADLRGEGEAARVADLVHAGPVRLVEMGHTHYNELANDGRTVYAAARSTGQIEEGPVGYAVAAIDRGAVSWRFKALADPWPFVLITAPADRRLAHDPAHIAGYEFEVRALVLGDEPIVCCECSLGDGPWMPMVPTGAPGRFALRISDTSAARSLRVRAADTLGRQAAEAVEPARDPGDLPPAVQNPGSDADALGAWPEKGILGTQLGPNRNGRTW